MKCPNQKEWDLLAMQVLDGDHSEQLRVHLLSCSVCRETYKNACRDHAERMKTYDAFESNCDASRDQLMALLHDEPVPTASQSSTVAGKIDGGAIRGVRHMKRHKLLAWASSVGVAAAIVLGFAFLVHGQPKVKASTVLLNLRELAGSCELMSVVCRNVVMAAPRTADSYPFKADMSDIQETRNNIDAFVLREDGDRGFFACNRGVVDGEYLATAYVGELPGKSEWAGITKNGYINSEPVDLRMTDAMLAWQKIKQADENDDSIPVISSFNEINEKYAKGTNGKLIKYRMHEGATVSYFYSGSDGVEPDGEVKVLLAKEKAEEADYDDDGFQYALYGLRQMRDVLCNPASWENVAEMQVDGSSIELTGDATYTLHIDHLDKAVIDLLFAWLPCDLNPGLFKNATMDIVYHLENGVQKAVVSNVGSSNGTIEFAFNGNVEGFDAKLMDPVWYTRTSDQFLPLQNGENWRQAECDRRSNGQLPLILDELNSGVASQD